MTFADEVSRLSTCSRLQVGAVLTDLTMEQILGYGYNGNAAGLPNLCDYDEPGGCGCVHAELNALLKAGRGPKRAFLTDGPCVACAKAMINGGIASVRVARPYRDPSGLILLDRACISLWVEWEVGT